MAGINLLTTKQIDAWCKTGETARLNDGGGLYLVRGTGGRFAWSFLFTSPVTGKRREAGLGSMDLVGLANARKIAAQHRDVLATGGDPIQVKRRERAQDVTFSALAADTLETLKPEWRHVEREVAKWDRAIASCKNIEGTPARSVTIDDIADVLKPLSDRPTQKRFVLSVIRRVLDVAVAKGLRDGNPAVSRVVGKITSLAHKGEQNSAMSYRDVPAFVKGLRASDTTASRCLELIIRTGVRKTEATQATFSEFDLATGVWTIPPSRMKAGREHTVPLTDRALQIVQDQRAKHPRSEYVFPGGRRQPHLSHGAFQHLLPDDVTTHGFRSALRDYLGNETEVSFDTAEEVLGHLVGDRTVTAYRRTPGLAKRLAALTYWGDFLDGILEKNVNQQENRKRIQMVKG